MMLFFNRTRLERTGVIGPEIGLLLSWSASSRCGIVGLQFLNVTLTLGWKPGAWVLHLARFFFGLGEWVCKPIFQTASIIIFLTIIINVLS